MPSHYEPGKYKATVTAQRFGETPNGSAYFAVEFEPTESLGPNEFPANVYKREMTLYFTEKSAQYSIEKLRRMGWSGTKLSELDPSNEGFTSLAGTEVEVVCRLNEKEYDEWDMAPPSGGPAKESIKGISNKLDKLFGKALSTSAKGKKTAEPKKETVPPSGEDDEEIPF